MKSLTNELQYKIVQILRNDKDVQSFVDKRIFDQVPEDASFPYISIGSFDITTTPYDCFEIEDVSIQIDVWSRSVGFVEMREISHAVRHCLHNKDFELPNNAAILFIHQISRELRDPDGLTSHAALTFNAVVQIR
ncbi:DUF3168 domain-containing protein [Bartonella tamiae]|uniref:DUF3168 domain-containing protein n=1 Tax=Bartonella tamiae Th239 TaxID=1094558 RepID=J1K3H3_9HYPH|nr:DUF3168 domain-containing protein [Bartonella tamiae]EJF91680.1 hypothetical protein ME5_00059 [Bartonella tamiae Th239]